MLGLSAGLTGRLSDVVAVLIEPAYFKVFDESEDDNRLPMVSFGLRLSDAHFAADLAAVHLLDGFRGLLFICKTNESKAAWAPGVAVGWDVNFHHLADLGEQLAELPIRHGEVEITYEYLV